MLVGKPAYFEDGMVFEDVPSLMESTTTHLTDVHVVQREQNTVEKVNLWRQQLKQEFQSQYKEVAFNSADKKSYYYNSGVEDVI